jgi:pimeloyl-ACP methyl ester carboxylesterase
VDALARSFRVITFSLCDEAPGRRRTVFDEYEGQVRAALDQRGVERAIVCGISFGGLIALGFAATHLERTSGLVLASTPGPTWSLRKTHALYTRCPRLFAPFFFLGAPRRLNAEIRAALPLQRDRRRFRSGQLKLLVKAPLSPARMAARARLIATIDVARLCERVTAPTLVVTGEPHLDHVVAAGGTLEYATRIRGASQAVLESTGHLGYLTRPDAFAMLVARFFADLGSRSTFHPDAA